MCVCVCRFSTCEQVLASGRLARAAPGVRRRDVPERHCLPPPALRGARRSASLGRVLRERERERQIFSFFFFDLYKNSRRYASRRFERQTSRFTVVVSTVRGEKLPIPALVRHYVNSSTVERVVVVWRDPKTEPPRDSSRVVFFLCCLFFPHKTQTT